ncbi:TetR/AcrR family transcriptional regulator [Oscillibacter sp. MSJ-2]|uniref:TetR/AcrR family transcriptional regulator n=1 Tax=Dysosmobacter acutus TaxID=2841504 RepID=A0ABS6FB13_9FIRM|nr:TetR/AcrR family transcriptional regulator [Dysosmobacter acutus]MBU5627482.1 TetR/AcrR family transcriptional regulator [Dysosmobacter acutus]
MKSAGLREQLLSAAEKLFAEQGYANTTVDQIVEVAGCSKSTFYHYFEAKEELACTPDLYDYAYEQWYETARDTDENAISKLHALNRVFLSKLEQTYDLDRASATCRFEVATKNRGSYIGSNRSYNRIIRTLIKEGQAKGEIRDDISFVELSKVYSLLERGIIFDWCISGGTYSFMEFGTRSMDILLRGYLPVEP